MSNNILIENWGRIEYREAWDKQKHYFQQLISCPESDERIIAVEHFPVYTLGFHGNADNLLVTEAALSAAGAECLRIERGGDITYHGPGQVVVYPIINLRKHGLGVKDYINLLENSVIELLSFYGIHASCNSEAIGLWIDWDLPSARKICAIGVKISHGVTMHGLALNVNTDLRAFSLINPCGFIDKGVTSMSHELNHELDAGNIANHLCEIIRSKLTENFSNFC